MNAGSMKISGWIVEILIAQFNPLLSGVLCRTLENQPVEFGEGLELYQKS